MKSFESFLAPKMEQYLAYRKALGYNPYHSHYLLLHFDRYVQKIPLLWDELNPLYFLTFRESLQKEHTTVNRIMEQVKNFFQFLVREGEIEENPVRDIPSLKKRLFIPFVFSEGEIEAFLCSLRESIRKEPHYFLKDLSLYCALLLQARCGLRISEPRALLLSHFHAQERCIYIEKTKFKKDRLIPIPEEVARDITNYLAVRKSLRKNDQNPYLLCGRGRFHISKGALLRTFHKAVNDCVVYQPRRVIGTMIFGSPTTHSLRHSFAINTLIRAKKKGRSPQCVLPYLAAYMGHCKYQCTAVYLKVLNALERRALADYTASVQGQL
ncbi:MAG: tyrosine-type recombinase/integrase [bacterium]